LSTLITRLPPISPSMRRSLLAIELFGFAVCIWFNIGDPQIQRSSFTVELISLLGLALIPFIAIFPANFDLWARRLYLLAGLAVVIVAEYYQLTTYLFYSTFLLKGCFLLPRRENILIAILFLVISTISYTIRAPELIKNLLQGDMKVYLTMSRMIPNYIASSLGSCMYVLLLGSVWMEEQKSRQRAESLAQQVENLAVDLERNRIARDIHDTLGHSLTSLDVQIELAQRLQATEPTRAQQSINLAKKLSSQALDNVRQALGTMKRSNFDLTEAIVALSEQNYPFQILVDVRFPQLSLQTSYQLYCIVQESLTNIQKHAQADQVTITGSIISNGTILEICDNGKGFNLVGVASALPNRPHAGFGLRNMKERVQCLGGNFNLNSEIDQGTKIKIFVPI
jgi:signal transduction histidine kinase